LSGRPESPPDSSARACPSTPARDYRGVGGDHAVDPVLDQQLRDALDRQRLEIGRDLDRDRRVLAVALRERLLLGFERAAARSQPLPAAARAGPWCWATRC
jgi:hypothetical protein